MLADHIDIQGHRGCRGLMPENTIPGFIRALKSGVTTLEMDVVIAADYSVVVSHDPFFHHYISIGPDRLEINEKNMHTHNMFKMDYPTIASYDVGLKPHIKFPLQRKMPTIKPKLSMVFDTIEAYLKANILPTVQYSIEIKRKAKYDNQFHPDAETFIGEVLKVLAKYDLNERIILQCFDIETLQLIHQKKPDIKLAYIIASSSNFKDNIDRLGFVPDIYSQAYKLVDTELLQYCNKQGMKLIPWTINEVSDLERIMLLGVHGIISDYPDRAIEIFKGLQLSKG